MSDNEKSIRWPVQRNACWVTSTIWAVPFVVTFGWLWLSFVTCNKFNSRDEHEVATTIILRMGQPQSTNMEAYDIALTGTVSWPLPSFPLPHLPILPNDHLTGFSSLSSKETHNQYPGDVGLRNEFARMQARLSPMSATNHLMVGEYTHVVVKLAIAVSWLLAGSLRASQ